MNSGLGSDKCFLKKFLNATFAKMMRLFSAAASMDGWISRLVIMIVTRTFYSLLQNEYHKV